MHAASISPPDLSPRRIMSFAQWCELLGISAATGRRILARGEGPPVIRLSERRIGIDAHDNDSWLSSRKTRVSA